MKLVISVPVLNQQQVTQEFLDNFGEDRPEIILIDNGSNPPVRNWLKGLKEGDVVIRNEENAGLIRALNQAYIVAKNMGADYIFYTHNDVRIYEQGWYEKLLRVLQHENNRIDVANIKKVGVAGFYGAKGIGTSDIYRSPYLMQQMIRLENVSGCIRMDPIHGYRLPRGETEDVAVMDGFSLIVSVELLKQIDGFDRNYPPHHMYDNDICMESLDKGYRNIVISMDAQHLGGRTDVNEDWSKPFGKTKQEIHRDAHPVFYKKWSPEYKEKGIHKICLPIRIP